jgi:hypothetical protein
MKKMVNGTAVEMTAQEIADLQASRAADPTPIPQEVTMRQARLALFGAGLLASVESAIDALPEPQKTAARIEWDHSQTVQRSRGIVLQLGTAMGLSSAQIDALFVQAAAL